MDKIEKAIKELQDSLIVISEIERRQSALIKEHSERIVEHDLRFLRIDARLDRITEKLEGAADKLNGLIGYVAGQNPAPPPPR